MKEVEIGSIWQHRNGNRYTVTNIANLESEDQDKYPTTVVYEGVTNGKVWSRPLSDWHRSMTYWGGVELHIGECMYWDGVSEHSKFHSPEPIRNDIHNHPDQVD